MLSWDLNTSSGSSGCVTLRFHPVTHLVTFSVFGSSSVREHHWAALGDGSDRPQGCAWRWLTCVPLVSLSPQTAPGVPRRSQRLLSRAAGSRSPTGRSLWRRGGARPGEGRCPGRRGVLPRWRRLGHRFLAGSGGAVLTPLWISLGKRATEGPERAAHGGVHVQRAQEARLRRRLPLAIAVH